MKFISYIRLWHAYNKSINITVDQNSIYSSTAQRLYNNNTPPNYIPV
jgi:hypothetical protein